MRVLGAVLAAIWVLTGCEPDEATVRPAKGPDGERAWFVDCSGQYLTRNHCHQRFLKLCGKRGGEVLEDTPHGMLVHCHPKSADEG